MLSRVFVCDNDDQLADFAVLHPPVQLAHDLFDVGLDLVIGRDEHVEAIFLDGGEVLGWVDSSLETAARQLHNRLDLPMHCPGHRGGLGTYSIV